MAGPGRPRGSANAKKTRRPKAKELDTEKMPPTFKCTRCGRIIQGDPKGYFYMSKSVGLYSGNGDYCGICISCCNELFKTFKEKYSDERLGLILTCCATGLYYSDDLYASTKEKIIDTFGTYAKCLNGTQYRNKSFNTFLLNLIEGTVQLKDNDELREVKEAKWKSGDKKNKRYVVETVGYDPFDDDSYTDRDRIFLFNCLAGYLTDEVIEDPHRLQSVITLSKTTLQKETIDAALNLELRKNAPDYPTIKQLTDIKTNLNADINKTASENGISAKSSGKSGKKSNTLTTIMKEMGENGFEEIKANLTNAKLADSYREVASINAKAIMNELNFTGDEFASMLAEQSEVVRKQQETIERIEEELRLSKLALKEEKEKGRRK